MKTKHCLSLVLALVLVCSLFSIGVSAASATFSLSGSTSVIVGNQIRVTVKVSGSEKIGSWRFAVNYDPAFLDYVSGADSGGAGAVLLSDSSDGVASVSKTLVFRAKKIGSTNVAIASGAQVVSFDSASNMSVNAPSRRINITAAPNLSGDNNLASLVMAEGELTPDFDKNTTAYTASVPFAVSAVNFAATPGHAAASVAVSDAALKEGENVITVTVTAQNGKTKVYTITVTRTASEYAGAQAEIDGKTYQIAYDPAALTPPEGFTPGEKTYGDKKILAYLSPKESISAVYLVSEEVSGWYLFDEENQVFSKMVTLTGAANGFVILPAPKDNPLPESFTSTLLSVGEESVLSYQTEDLKEKGIFLVYAMAKDGTLGFYYFDSALNSFLSYFDVSSQAPNAIPGNAVPGGDSDSKTENILIIVCLALGVLSASLLLALVLVLLKKGKKKEEPALPQTRPTEDTLLVMGDGSPPFQTRCQRGFLPLGGRKKDE